MGNLQNLLENTRTFLLAIVSRDLIGVTRRLL